MAEGRTKSHVWSSKAVYDGCEDRAKDVHRLSTLVGGSESHSVFIDLKAVAASHTFPTVYVVDGDSLMRFNKHTGSLVSLDLKSNFTPVAVTVVPSSDIPEAERKDDDPTDDVETETLIVAGVMPVMGKKPRNRRSAAASAGGGGGGGGDAARIALVRLTVPVTADPLPTYADTDLKHMDDAADKTAYTVATPTFVSVSVASQDRLAPAPGTTALCCVGDVVYGCGSDGLWAYPLKSSPSSVTPISISIPSGAGDTRVSRLAAAAAAGAGAGNGSGGDSGGRFVNGAATSKFGDFDGKGATGITAVPFSSLSKSAQSAVAPSSSSSKPNMVLVVAAPNQHTVAVVLLDRPIPKSAGTARPLAMEPGLPSDVVVDTEHGLVLVADAAGHCIRGISLTGSPTRPKVATTVVGRGYPDTEDGSGGFAMLNGPSGLSVDGEGHVYVMEPETRLLRLLSRVPHNTDDEVLVDGHHRPSPLREPDPGPSGPVDAPAPEFNVMQAIIDAARYKEELRELRLEVAKADGARQAGQADLDALQKQLADANARAAAAEKAAKDAQAAGEKASKDTASKDGANSDLRDQLKAAKDALKAAEKAAKNAQAAAEKASKDAASKDGSNSDLRDQLKAAKDALKAAKTAAAKDAAAAKKRAKEMDARIAGLEADNKAADAKLADAGKTGDAADRRASDAEAKLAAAKADADANAKKLAELEAALKAAQAALKDQEKDAAAKQAALQKALNTAKDDAAQARRELAASAEHLDSLAAEAAGAQAATEDAAALAKKLAKLEAELKAANAARDDAQSKLKSANTDLAAATALAEFQKGELEALASERDAANKEANDATAEAAKASNAADAARAAADAEKGRRQDAEDQLKKLMDEVNALRKELKNAENDVAEKEQEVKDATDETVAAHQEADQAKAELEDAIKAATDLTARIQRLKDEIKKLKDQLAALKADKAAADKANQKLESQLAAVEAEKEASHAEGQDMKNALDALKAEKSAEKDADGDAIQKLKAALEALNGEKATLQKANADANDEIKKLKEALAALEADKAGGDAEAKKLKKALDTMTGKKKKADDEIKKLKEALAALEADKAGGDAEAKKLKKALDTMTGKKKAADDEIKKLREALEALKADKDASDAEAKKLKKALDALQADKDASDAENKTLKDDVAALTSHKDAATAEIQRLEKALDEAGQAQQDAEKAVRQERLRPVRPLPPDLLNPAKLLSQEGVPIRRLCGTGNIPQLAQVFDTYADGTHTDAEGSEPTMSLGAFKSFAKDYGASPGVCSEEQLEALFELVNRGEGADDDTSTLDEEEFVECFVRMGVYYNPKGYDPSDETGDVIADPVEDMMLATMNKSDGALGASPVVKFVPRKRGGKKSSGVTRISTGELKELTASRDGLQAELEEAKKRHDEERAALEAELEAARKTLGEKNSEMAKLQPALNTAQSDLDTARSDLAKAMAELDAANKRHDEQRAALTQLTAAGKAAKNQLAAAQKGLETDKNRMAELKAKLTETKQELKAAKDQNKTLSKKVGQLEARVEAAEIDARPASRSPARKGSKPPRTPPRSSPRSPIPAGSPSPNAGMQRQVERLTAKLADALRDVKAQAAEVERLQALLDEKEQERAAAVDEAAAAAADAALAKAAAAEAAARSPVPAEVVSTSVGDDDLAVPPPMKVQLDEAPLQSAAGVDGSVPMRRLSNGRLVPEEVVTGSEMISIISPPVNRCHLQNQTQFQLVFEHYADDDQAMSFDELSSMVAAYNIVPKLCTEEDLEELFVATNLSDASDGESDTLDREEATELLVRLAACYAPGDFRFTSPIAKDPSLAPAVRSLFAHMNANAPEELKSLSFDNKSEPLGRSPTRTDGSGRAAIVMTTSQRLESSTSETEMLRARVAHLEAELSRRDGAGAGAGAGAGSGAGGGDDGDGDDENDGRSPRTMRAIPEGVVEGTVEISNESPDINSIILQSPEAFHNLFTAYASSPPAPASSNSTMPTSPEASSEMTLPRFLDFAEACKLTTWANKAQLTKVWNSVVLEDEPSADSPDFIEVLCRVSVLYAPGRFSFDGDIRTNPDYYRAFRVLLQQLDDNWPAGVTHPSRLSDKQPSPRKKSRRSSSRLDA